MRAKLFLVFATVVVCVFSAAAQTVIEKESSIVINERTAEISLAIAGKNSGSTDLHLKLLDTGGNERGHVDQQIKVLSGTRKYKLSMPIGELMSKAADQVAWFRLAYFVGGSSGVISLSEMLRDDFDLRSASFERAVPGETMRVRVRSLNPFTQAAVKGVNITAELSLDLDTDGDEDTLKLNGTAKTDGEGFAVVDFKIPENAKLDGDGEITIRGQKNGVVRKIEDDLDDNNSQGSVVMTTDKPLYQPGQMFNVRALYFDAYNTIVPNSELEFTIKDENDTVMFRQTAKTSSFGIAAVSWQIPESAKLGSYSVNIEGDDDILNDEIHFKVTRYDLPNFSVTAKPDKTFYLPADATAQITISADYLFGKPVTRGKVRVVEETDRRWDYYSQTYRSDEGASYEGRSDADGKYVATVDLRDHFAQLASHQWERYQDVSFSAYYTDLTTNRTEQRRFDIRLSKEPIHVYLIRYNNYHPGLPVTGYVSTFYADGTPANCSVEISDGVATLARFHSNSLGAGKFEFSVPDRGGDRSEMSIDIVARDKRGNTGTMDESIYLDKDDAIQIRTDKTIYKAGDMIEVDLVSSRQSGYLYLDVVKDWQAIVSNVIRLHHGRAHLSIPYSPDFKGDITLAAYSDEDEGLWSDSMRANRGVIFPEQQNLILNAKFTKDAFKPNEDASVRFSVLDGSRKPVESAIGVGIFDKAIEERARTETEFGGYFNRFYRFLGYDRSFGDLALKDLNDLDMTRPISPEMQLAAEIMLASGWYYPNVRHSGNLDTRPGELYSTYIQGQLKPVKEVLDARYKKDLEYPSDADSLNTILSAAGLDLSKVVDPWGDPYVPEFNTARTQIVLTLRSAGPDKKFGTPDDFTAMTAGFNYFTKVGNAIDRAALQYHNATGRFIFDAPTLASELLKQNVDLAKLRDPYDRAYRVAFEVVGRSYRIRVYSIGPNGFEDQDNWRTDDFDVWQNNMDYFGASEQAINQVLNEQVNLAKKSFPQDIPQFVAMLKSGGVDLDSIKDGFGRTVYALAKKESRYVDKRTYVNGKLVITPATEEMLIIQVRSMGKDGVMSTDDAMLAEFSGAITEAYKGTNFSKSDVKTVVFSGAKGAISGVVTDAAGAVIPSATVTATQETDESVTFTTKTDDEGKFLLGNLPSGRYRLKIDATGFKSMVTTNIEVRSQNLVEMNAQLQAGAVAETVDVTASAPETTTNTTNASISNTVTKAGVQIKFPYKDQSSTPRLREYFPETLVWQPELLTDKKGRAELKFKMADNITTWKMFAIASTKRGKIGVVEKEVTAFQSFFADLDPPKFLTDGDEIFLPTQIRNYTDKTQKVVVTLDNADWFTPLGDLKQQINVPSGASENAVFGFKAAKAVAGGKQRVTAIGQTDSDAIEKPVTVRPNGEEIVRTDSRVFNGSAKIDLNFPANAITGSQHAELKIYPNLFSHVSESVEGLLERPYGCGEQTVSSTYPNMMIMKFVKADTPLRQKAAKYLQKGYDRLLNYQVADGGFSFWGGSDPSDVVLTAYALRFLTDAKQFIEVDEDVIERAENYLLKQQRADGSWVRRTRWETADDNVTAKLTTTYIVRSLALLKAAETSPDNSRNEALTRGIAYLKKRNAEIDEPYSMALFGLAALDAGDVETAKSMAAQLEKMAIPENSAVYWDLETNTPFYGWGTAGRIETTALAVQLLNRVARLDNKPASDTASRGLIFLLQNKDRYGVWYSTQTTVNVLDSFLAILASDRSVSPQTISVSVNGNALPVVAVAADRIEPLVLDLTGNVAAGQNSIELKSTQNAPLMAQLIGTHYIDWRDFKSANTDASDSRALRLDYTCDKYEPAVMDDVTCSVNAERVGFRGYGMLLAEIGTPPGAEVSRESLEAALKDDWSLSRYDILPDRIVLYMWAKAGGTKFKFKFRQRYRINAQTPASILYDYYNPEAHATVAPLRFATRNPS